MELLYPISDRNSISRIKLPIDTHPITVQYSLDRQSFLFLLQSESFPHVEPGEEIPCLDSELWSVARSQVILKANYRTEDKVIQKLVDENELKEEHK